MMDGTYFTAALPCSSETLMLTTPFKLEILSSMDLTHDWQVMPRMLIVLLVVGEEHMPSRLPS
jgi:hypothetical protein